MRSENTALKYNLDSATHPVEDGSYLIPTPPICDVSAKVMRLIKMRAPGAMVYGPPRFGKSKGIDYIRGDILDEFGEDFPVFSFTCRKYATPTEPTFWGDILRDLGHTESDTGTAWQKRVRLKSFILDRVFAARQKRAVFIADEGQKLQYLQFEWLQDLYNDLDEQGIAPIFILFGQKQLLQMRSAFINKGEMQIVGRFMVHSYVLGGCDLNLTSRNAFMAMTKDLSIPSGANLRSRGTSSPRRLITGGALVHRPRISGTPSCKFAQRTR